MTRLWFVVPVHGREPLATVCLRQLRRTCDALQDRVEATAVVVGLGSLLELASELGFATVERDNHQLGRKFNDGYQLATDPEYNPEPADYVVPCGSDDWVDHRLFHTLPDQTTIGVFRQLAVVDESRTRMAQLRVSYRGGAGIRIVPATLIAQAGYRPAEEDRGWGIDASSLYGLQRATRAHRGIRLRFVDLDQHPLQIVDWKTQGQQMNSYHSLKGFARNETTNLWDDLAAVYPAEALEEMAAL